jgi:hypothetical protein
MLPRIETVIIAAILILLVGVGVYIYFTSKQNEGFSDTGGSSLPEGWSLAYDDDGTPYYYTSSGLKQWEMPISPPPDDSSLPEGWSLAYDEDGTPYYFTSSGLKQWEMPISPPPDDSSLPEGWSLAYDEDGEPYYFTSSGLKQWEMPISPPPDDSSLPEGWSLAYDEDGVPYYFTSSGLKQWEMPISPPPDDSSLPEGWSLAYDEDGTPYYFTSSGLKQWELPISPPPVETALPATENKGLAQVPGNNDPSLITNAVPGSTTSNTNETLASFADIGALMEAIKTFQTYYDLNIISASRDPLYFDLSNDSAAHMTAIQDQMATGLIIDNYNYTTDLRIAYEKASKELKQKSRNGESPLEDKELSGGKSIKVKDIEIVIERADTENKILTALRSEDPVTKKRIANLLKIISDMKDLLDRIKRGKMNIKDVPFSKNDLSVLYNDIKNKDKSEVTSITMPKVNNTSSNKNTFAETGLNLDKNYNDILASVLKDLSWDIRIGYDPEVTLKRNMLDRIDSIKNDLAAGKLSEDQIKNKLLELDVIKQQNSSENRRLVTRSNKELKAYNKEDYDDMAEGYQPSPVENKNGSPINQPTSFDGNESKDWLLRPGYKMTDERIKTRGSDASFDPTSVGGPDYFKRAQFLCNQINDAGLGEPREFGCIDSKTVVSPEYSWKGNYLMVCSRLGTVWGGWYPEMFGCPPTQKSELQVPNKKIDRE